MNLTPNHAMKSQIEQWREDQKGVAANQMKLKGCLANLHWCTTSEEVASALSGLSECITESETPVPQCNARGSGFCPMCIFAPVKGALEVVEASCQAVTQTLQGKLRKA